MTRVHPQLMYPMPGRYCPQFAYRVEVTWAGDARLPIPALIKEAPRLICIPYRQGCHGTCPPTVGLSLAIVHPAAGSLLG